MKAKFFQSLQYMYWSTTAVLQSTVHTTPTTAYTNSTLADWRLADNTILYTRVIICDTVKTVDSLLLLLSRMAFFVTILTCMYMYTT